MKTLFTLLLGVLLSGHAFAATAEAVSSTSTTNYMAGVGIGTTAPQSKFHVRNSTDTNLRVFGTLNMSDGMYIDSSNDAGNAFKKLEIESSAIGLNATSGGGVAIGTTVTSAGVFTVNNASTHAGQATCWTTGGAIGYCTTVVGAGGGCTCTGL